MLPRPGGGSAAPMLAACCRRALPVGSAACCRRALPGDRAAPMLPRPAGDRPPPCCPRPARGSRRPDAAHALSVIGCQLLAIRSAPCRAALRRHAATLRCAPAPRLPPCSNPTGCSYPARPLPCPAPPTPQPLWGSPALRTPRALHPRRNPYGVAAPAPCALCIMRPASPHVATLRVALILRLRHGPHPGSARLPRPPHALRPQAHALRDSPVSTKVL